MESKYQTFRKKAFSALRGLAEKNPSYNDALYLFQMAEKQGSLYKSEMIKIIDTDWIEAIEYALPYLDTFFRKPNVAIEEVEELLPVELSKHINDKSVRHLAQHTNLIMDVQGDEITPQKILNVYHDETYLTYENKFVNTLLSRLTAFVEKRYNILKEGSGVENSYKFSYETEFDHNNELNKDHTSAKINLSIELTAPFKSKDSDEKTKINENYNDAINRIEFIHNALMAYNTSEFATKLGRNYIRPPVIRTNAILKNKNLKECLVLWEFIEGFIKVGYDVSSSEGLYIPSDEFLNDLYSTVALQYVNFLNGVNGDEDTRLLSKKYYNEATPEFERDLKQQQEDKYDVLDSLYEKIKPISRLVNSRSKLSADEKRIATAIEIALRVDNVSESRRKERHKNFLIKQLEEERARLARLEEERIAQEELERLRKEEEEKLKEELRKAHLEEFLTSEIVDIFAPEDGNYEGKTPLCPFTQKRYFEFDGKKRKVIRQNMQKILRYRANQKQIALKYENDRNYSKIAVLIDRCARIAKNLPSNEGWKKVIKCHTFVRGSFNAKIKNS